MNKVTKNPLYIARSLAMYILKEDTKAFELLIKTAISKKNVL